MLRTGLRESTLLPSGEVWAAILDGAPMLTVRGEGEPGSQGGPFGDLYGEVHIRPHPLFQRTLDDIKITSDFLTIWIHSLCCF